MSARAATYVYCLLHEPEAAALAGAPPGLEGLGPPRLVDLGSGLHLVAADAPLELYGAESIEHGLRDVDWVSRRALAHEAVLEHLLGRGTVLPMKLFTLFHSDERAAADIASRRAHVDALVAALRGREEWGVRVFLERAGGAAAAEERPRAESGRAFLEEKRRRRDAARRAGEEAARAGERLFATLAARATEARRRPPAAEGGTLVLDAAFLVDSEASGEFALLVRESAGALAAGGLRVALTGPWPPYHFVAPEEGDEGGGDEGEA